MANKIQKKLIYFVPQFPVLTETFIEREVSKLVEFGNFDITILSQAPGSGALSDNLVDKVRYVRLTFVDCLVAFCKFVLLQPLTLWETHKLVTGKDSIPYLFSLRNEHDARTKQSILGRFHKSRFIHFWKGVAYAQIFSKFAPDHIHSQFLSDSSTIVMISAKILDIPFSVSAHAKDVFVEGSLISIKARESKFISVCNGNTWKEVINHANLTKSSRKVKLLFHGIDPSKFFSVALPPKTDVPLVFTIARLVEKKGIRYLIEASEILKRRGVRHKVKIGGGGPLYNDLQSMIISKGLIDTVEILGTQDKNVPNAVVAGWLQVADIYAAPFIVADSGDVDGVPTTVIEAALARLPIVATDSGSMGDLVTSKTGIIVPQKDSQALADVLEKLIVDKDLCARLGDVVYKQAVTQFNIEHNVRELEKLLLE